MRVLAITATLTLAFAAEASASPAAMRAPDLVVRSVGAPPAVMQPGDRFRVGAQVRNRGRAAAGRSATAFYLSKDRRLDRKDPLLAGLRVARSVRAGKSSPASATVLIPASVVAGKYLVLACADAFRRVRERNERNNCGASSRSASVASPPAAPQLRDHPGALTNAASARFVFSTTAARPPVRFSCQLDGRPLAPCASPVRYAGVEEGDHTFVVKAHDREGRESAAKSFRWHVDLTSPPTPALEGRPGDPTNLTSATFSFAGHESEARLECTLDWGPASVCTSPQSYAGLSEGRHVFAVRARDRANNESSFRTYDWAVDVTPPSAPTITSGPPALTNLSSGTISFSSGEGAYRCRLDGSAFAPCSSPYAFAALPDALHTFAVKALDAAGNESAAAVHTWRSDAPPRITFAAHPSDPTNSRSAHFQFSASEEVSGYRCRLDGTAIASCANPITYAGPLTEGGHTLTVTAKDAVGQEGSATFNWRVDLTPPQLGQLTTFPENPSNGQPATFAFSESESGLRYLCRLDGAPAFSACANPQTYVGLGHGSHRFEAKTRDAAGNESAATRVHQWLVSTTPPPAPGLDLGVYRAGGPAAVREYEAWLKRPIKTVLDYLPGSSWAALSSPDGIVAQWNLSGYRIVYSTPMLPNSGATLDEGATGAYDTYFRQLAQTLVRWGQGNVVIRLGWEFNGNWFSWKAKGKTAEFVTYWRRIVNVMRSVSPNFKFDWNPAYGPLDFDADDAYPGDAYVDFIGLVVFDQGWEPGYHDPILRWRNFISLPFALEWHVEFARAHGKPMTFPEWGLTFRDDFPGHGGGDNPYYVDKMYLWLTANPVAYAIYFEHDKAGEVRHSLINGHFPNGSARFKTLFGGS